MVSKLLEDKKVVMVLKKSLVYISDGLTDFDKILHAMTLPLGTLRIVKKIFFKIQDGGWP